MGGAAGGGSRPSSVVLVGLLAATCCGGGLRCSPIDFGLAESHVCSAAAVAGRATGTGTVAPSTTTTGDAGQGSTVSTGRPLSLIGAASIGNTETVARLLDQGADIDQANDDRRTALFCAVLNEHRDTALLLIARHADVNLANLAGDTPLLWAADHGDLPLVQALLDAGADPNRYTKQGHGPLFRALAAVHEDVASLLLERGAEPDHAGLVDPGSACGTVGELHARGAALPPAGFPTTTASAADTGAYASWLATQSTAGRPPGTSAAEVQGLLPGCPPTATSPYRSVAPLAMAVYLFRPALVEQLLAKGADPNRLAFDRFSPLYLAAVLGDDRSASALLDKGASPAPAVDGVPTPWEAACANAHITTARLVGTAARRAAGRPGPLPVACPPEVGPGGTPARPAGTAPSAPAGSAAGTTPPTTPR